MRVRTFAIALVLLALASPSALGVIGGRDADPGEYPFMAALVSVASTDDWSGQFCGGSLVAPTFVVTAAHCVSTIGLGLGSLGLEPATRVNDLINDRPYVVLGKTTLTDDGGERILVKQAYVHPFYNAEGSTDNDIALLELMEPSTAPTVAWATSGDAALYAPGVESTVIGWGLNGDDEYPETLQEAEVPIVSDADCQDAYDGDIDEPTQICAGYLGVGGVDTCAGDSGGPLLVRKNGAWLLAGITSWGNGCAEPDYPGVYSEVGALSAFIEAHVS